MMRSATTRMMWLLLCVVVSACGDESSPTAPTATATFNGQWTGSTSHGQPITLTIASDRVTAATVGYNYGGCSGTKTATDLNIGIVDLRTTGAQAPPEPYSFQSLLGPYSESDNTQITGFFKSPSENSGHGVVLFVRPGCGETIALWTATRR